MLKSLKGKCIVIKDFAVIDGKEMRKHFRKIMQKMVKKYKRKEK